MRYIFHLFIWRIEQSTAKRYTDPIKTYKTCSLFNILHYYLLFHLFFLSLCFSFDLLIFVLKLLNFSCCKKVIFVLIVLFCICCNGLLLLKTKKKNMKWHDICTRVDSLDFRNVPTNKTKLDLCFLKEDSHRILSLYC